MMASHRIGRQVFTVDADDEATALRLRPELEVLNRMRLLPALQGVMERLDRPGDLMLVSRIDVDLGTIPLEDLEDRLVDAFHQALTEAAAQARHAPGPEDRVYTAAEAVRVDVESWLDTGSPRGETAFLSFEHLIRRMDAGAIRDLVRGRIDDPVALDRLVLQLSDDALAAVMRALAPTHADSLLGILRDALETLRREALSPVDMRDVERRLWRRALELAAGHADVPALAAAARTLVGEVLGGHDRGPGSPEPDGLQGAVDLSCETGPPDVLPGIASIFTTILGGGSPPEESSPGIPDLLRDAEPLEISGVLAAIRQYGSDRAALRRLVIALDEIALEALVTRLDPWNAALILAYQADLRRAHATQPVAELTEPAFEQTVWIVVLAHIAAEPRGHFSRKSFIGRLIRELANEAGASETALLAALYKALSQTARRLPVSASLTQTISELAQARAEPDSPTPPGAHLADLAALVESTAAGDILSADLPRVDLEAARRIDPARTADLLVRLGGALDTWPGRPTTASDLFRPQDLLSLVPAGQRVAFELMLKRVGRVMERTLSAGDARDRVWTAAAQLLLLGARRPFHPTRFADLLMRRLVDSGGLPRDCAALEEIDGQAGPPTHGLKATRGKGAARWRRFDALAANSTIAGRRQFANDSPSEWIDQGGEDGEGDLAALKHLLRTGRLPWPDVIALPALTPRALARNVLAFDRAGVRRLFAGLSGADQRAMARRLIQFLGRRQLALLTRRLAGGQEPHIADADALLALVLPEHPSPGADGLSPAISAPPVAVEAVLKDIIMSALRSGRRSGRDADGGVAEALHTLAELSPGDARQFLRVLARDAGLARALRTVVDSRTLAGLLRRLRPRIAGEIANFLQMAAASQSAGATLAFDLVRLEGSEFMAPFLWADGGPSVHEISVWLQGAGESWLAAAVDRRNASVPPASSARAAVWKAALGLAIDQGLDRSDTLRPDTPASEERRAVLAMLGGTQSDVFLSDNAMEYALLTLIQRDDPEILHALRSGLADADRREAWIARLTDRALRNLFLVLNPAAARASLRAEARLAEAKRSLGETVADDRPDWPFLFDFLARTPPSSRTAGALVRAYIAPLARARPDIAERILTAADRLGTARGEASLTALVRIAAPVPSPHPRSRAPAPTARSSFSLQSDRPRSTAQTPIYINNAGLVLAHPFIAPLFRELDLVGVGSNGKPRLRDIDAVSRAVHLLQFLIDGRTDAAEPLLVLNKLLCGVPPAQPVAAAIEMTTQEHELCERVLRSMIGNWTAMRDTSVEGLREFFLQREGVLTRADAGWQLTVSRKTVDVLVDQAPWTLSVILLPWMSDPVHVGW